MARKTKVEVSSEARLERKMRALQADKSHTDRKYKALQDELNNVKLALGQALEITSHKPKTFKITSRKTSSGEGTLVALLSDVHCDEIVPKNKVHGLNEHNPEISQRRVLRFFELVVRFIRVEREETPINNLVLWLGGDFFTGSESHGTPVAMDTSMAVMFAQDMIYSGIRYILEQEPNLNLHIVGSVGNHSRLSGGLKPVNIAREQGLSLEWFMYHALKSQFANEKRVTFQLDESYMSYVDVYNKKIRFCHGHLGFRYNQGLAGIHGPLFKAISQTWDNQIAADMTCIGHYHCFTPAALARPYMCNGSVIGATPYGIQFGFEPPAQMLFLVHSKYGVVGQRPLFVGVENEKKTLDKQDVVI